LEWYATLCNSVITLNVHHLFDAPLSTLRPDLPRGLFPWGFFLTNSVNFPPKISSFLALIVQIMTADWVWKSFPTSVKWMNMWEQIVVFLSV